MLNETKGPLGVHWAASSITASQHIPLCIAPSGFNWLQRWRGQEHAWGRTAACSWVPARLPGKCPRGWGCSGSSVALAGPAPIAPAPSELQGRDKPQDGSELLSQMPVAPWHGFERGIGCRGCCCCAVSSSPALCSSSCPPEWALWVAARCHPASAWGWG